MTSLPVFPNNGSIPPASFYNLQGLSNWLNNNPTYKQYYINYPSQFPNLYAMNSTLSTLQYDISKVPLGPLVTTLNQSQAIKYQQQLCQFRKVYTINSNAYVNSVVNNRPPVFYSYASYQELMEQKMALSLVNKMYPFEAMAYGKNEDGVSMNWVVPFPLV